MYKHFFRLLFTVIGLSATLLSMAQDSVANEKPAMAEAMRSNGKIYVVIAVLLTILFGILVYVVRLDRKITNMEKENKA